LLVISSFVSSWGGSSSWGDRQAEGIAVAKVSTLVLIVVNVILSLPVTWTLAWVILKQGYVLLPHVLKLLKIQLVNLSRPHWMLVLKQFICMHFWVSQFGPIWTLYVLVFQT